jgi:hypothetical protein
MALLVNQDDLVRFCQHWRDRVEHPALEHAPVKHDKRGALASSFIVHLEVADLYIPAFGKEGAGICWLRAHRVA